MAFHQPPDMQAFCRMHNVEETSDRTADTMAKPSRDGCTIVQEVSLGTRGYSLKKTLDQTTLAQITPAQPTRKAATTRNTQVSSSGKTPMEVAMGRRPRDLPDPAEQLTSTPTKQDLPNEAKIGYENSS